MKKLSNYAFAAILGFLVFNFFIKNKAEADGKLSYDSFLSGKALFIDVREQSEVNEGMIKGALWFPLSKIEQNKKSEILRIQQATKDKEVFVYCKSGNRAGTVKAYLEEAGTKSVNMGGFSGLVKDNLPTQSGLN